MPRRKTTAPVRRAAGRARPISTDDVKINQPKPIDDHRDYAGEVIDAVSDVLADKDYLDRLAFNDEPVTIQLARESGKNAAEAVYCSVNGKGIEILINGKWVSMLWAPVATVFTTKRKYAEVLMRAKRRNVDTNYGKINEHSEYNQIVPSVTILNAVQMVRDDNPRGVAWFSELVQMAA